MTATVQQQRVVGFVAWVAAYGHNRTGTRVSVELLMCIILPIVRVLKKLPIPERLLSSKAVIEVSNILGK